MKIKQRIAATILGVGALIGAWFSGMLPGFGSGDGDGAAETPSASVNADPAAAPQTPPAAATTPPPAAATEQPAEPPPLRRLVVYVDGTNFSVPVADGGVQKVSAQFLLRTAARTTGDDDGIRVLVLLTKDARYNTWSRLVDELVQSDIPRTAISIPEKMVELPSQATTSES